MERGKLVEVLKYVPKNGVAVAHQLHNRQRIK